MKCIYSYRLAINAHTLIIAPSVISGLPAALQHTQRMTALIVNRDLSTNAIINHGNDFSGIPEKNIYTNTIKFQPSSAVDLWPPVAGIGYCIFSVFIIKLLSKVQKNVLN